MTDEVYAQVLRDLPKEVADKLLIPMANLAPMTHKDVVAFLRTINEQGYFVRKGKD